MRRLSVLRYPDPQGGDPLDLPILGSLQFLAEHVRIDFIDVELGITTERADPIDCFQLPVDYGETAIEQHRAAGDERSKRLGDPRASNLAPKHRAPVPVRAVRWVDHVRRVRNYEVASFGDPVAHRDLCGDSGKMRVDPRQPCGRGIDLYKAQAGGSRSARANPAGPAARAHVDDPCRRAEGTKLGAYESREPICVGAEEHCIRSGRGERRVQEQAVVETRYTDEAPQLPAGALNGTGTLKELEQLRLDLMLLERSVPAENFAQRWLALKRPSQYPRVGRGRNGYEVVVPAS
jgi:hypothetical protein